MKKPSIVKGWNIPKSEYEQVHNNNGLLKLVTEFTNVCNLSCLGCFTKKQSNSFTPKRKKRLESEISLDSHLKLIDEASDMGVRVVDVVGAGEPTLDPNFRKIVDHILSKNMQVVIFTHGATKQAHELAVDYKNKDVSFFVKLWSRDSNLQDRYVQGSVEDYTKRRNEFLNSLIHLGYNSENLGKINLDGIDYRKTRVGADILVMRSNLGEIPELFKYCRTENFMPEIKTYIPEGPTRFDQEENRLILTEPEFEELKKDKILDKDYSDLVRKLVKIDKEEFNIEEMNTFYPQGSKCTQSMSSMYVTIQGDVRSCVGTHISYGNYPNISLKEVVEMRNEREKVGFGCIPRIDEINGTGLKVPENLLKLYQ